MLARMADENQGDAPLTESPVAQQAAEIQGAPADPAEELGAGFKLADVDEAYRPDVERYVKQAQGAFTRKTQELARERQQARDALDFQARLEDDQTREEALRELLNRYDLDLELEDDGGYEPDAGSNGAGETEAELVRRLAAIEARESQREADGYAQRVQTRLAADLNEWAQGRGMEEAPEHVVNQVLANLQNMAPLDDGMPDTRGALELYEAEEARVIEHYLKGKRSVPRVDTSGTSQTTSHVDLSDRSARLRKAAEIAGRHDL